MKNKHLICIMDDFLGVFDLLVDKLMQVLRRKSVPEDAIEHVVEVQV